MLFKQSLGVGGLPTPFLVWELGPRREGRLRNASSCCSRATAGKTGGRLGETTGPPRPKEPPNAQTGNSAATYRLRPRGSSAHLQNGKVLPALFTAQVVRSTRPGPGKTPRGRRAQGLLAHPPPTGWALRDQPRGRGLVPSFQKHVALNFPPGPPNSGGASSLRTV